MGFGLLEYTLATGGATTDTDMSALTDSDFTQRNSHYTFTERYRLLAQMGMSANMSRMNVQVPHWNAIGRMNVWPFSKSTDMPTEPMMMWLDSYPPVIPQNEEYTVKHTGTTSEQAWYWMWIVTDDWNANLPQGALSICVRVTATITIVANNWSSLGQLTFEQSLRGGVYAVVGAQFQGTHMQAFRLVFPRYKLYNGRKLRPGALAQNAIGDLEEPRVYNNPMLFGEWGRFHTFELPQLEITGNTAGSTAIEGRLWLIYLGESQSLLNQGMGGNIAL